MLNKYHTALDTVQTEAADVEEIYRLSVPLPEAKQERVQTLDATYARVVVEEEWPLMRQGKRSPRADAIIKELRGSIQHGYKTSTGTEQDFFGEQLGVMDDLDQCPDTAAGSVVNQHGCSIAQLAPCAGPSTGGIWKNHGAYVTAVSKAATAFVVAGDITQEEAVAVVDAAAKSDCGKK